MPEEDGVTRRHWKDGSLVNSCESPSYTRAFSVTVRRHHCRKCGLVFCWKCSKYRLPLHAQTLAVDFKGGQDCRVCDSCYNRERQWSNHDKDEAKRNKKAAKALADELDQAERGLRRAVEDIEERDREIEALEAKVEQLREGKERAQRRVEELEGHVNATALVAKVHKRKIRSDTSTTPWKERLVVASPAGIKYYKAQPSVGAVDLKTLSLVTGCIHTKETSPVKGGRNGPANASALHGLQMIQKDGTIYEFTMPNGEHDVSLWQRHVDMLIESQADKTREARGSSFTYGSEADSGEEDSRSRDDGIEESRRDNPFKMGWLKKQPGSTGFWQKRWFVVSDGLIAYYKSKSIVNPIQQISLVNAEVRQIKVPGKSLWCFQLFVPTSNRLFVMETSSSEELVQWIATIRGAAKYAQSLNLGEGNVDGEGSDKESVTDEFEEDEDDDVTPDDSD